jgi:hypothetical protein
MFLAHAVTLDFNGKLADALADVRGQTNANIIAFDTFSAVNAVVTDPGGFGFTNVMDSCLNVSLIPCADPDQYLFWDNVHPTTQAHQLLGDQFAAAVVPLPAAVWLFGFGLLGLIGVAGKKWQDSANPHRVGRAARSVFQYKLQPAFTVFPYQISP